MDEIEKRLYEKELIGSSDSRTLTVYALRPVDQARKLLISLRSLKVEKRTYFAKLEYEDAKGI